MLEKYALWKVLDILANAKKEYSIREMSRTAKVSPSAAKACLDYLHQRQLLKKDVIGNVHQYSLDSSHNIARHIRNIFIMKSLAKHKSPNSRIYLCSNDDEVVVFILGDIMHIPGLKTIHVTEQEFDEIRKNYLDVITIQ